MVTPLIYDQGYIPFLLDYCSKWHIDLLIPLFDIDLPVLSASREAFARQGTMVVTAEPAAIEICNDKWKTFRALKARGILTPKSWLSAEDAVRAAEKGEVSYPLILKPRWGMGSLSVYQADNKEEAEVLERKIRKEIRESYMKYEAAKDWEACVILQEKISGRELGVDVVNDLKGNFRTAAAKVKSNMRAGETDGAMTVSEPRLTELGMALSGLLRHKGNLDVDVVESGGEYYVLEMNARFGGGYPFSHAAGLNLPYALVMWASGREPEEKFLQARTGVRGPKDIRILVY